jgi:hypothetical protein
LSQITIDISKFSNIFKYPIDAEVFYNIILFGIPFSSYKYYLLIEESYNLKILNWHFTDMQYHPFYIERHSTVVIFNMLFSKCGRSLFIGHFSKVSIHSCAFQNAITNSMHIIKLIFLCVSKCSFKHCQRSVYFDYCNNATIDDCLFENCQRVHCINQCLCSLWTRLSFEICGISVSIVDSSFIILEWQTFDNFKIVIECFPNCSLMLLHFQNLKAQNQPKCSHKRFWQISHNFYKFRRMTVTAHKCNTSQFFWKEVKYPSQIHKKQSDLRMF